MSQAAQTCNGIEIDGVRLAVEETKPWFIGLYPNLQPKPKPKIQGNKIIFEE
jgi:hypothetical protein